MLTTSVVGLKARVSVEEVLVGGASIFPLGLDVVSLVAVENHSTATKKST